MGNFHSKNYIDYKSNGNKNKTISIKDYLEETKPYKTSDSYKIQLTTSINFMSSKDTGKV